MNFLSTTEFDLQRLIESAQRFKAGDDQSKPLSGKSVALVFFNPSLRTRASMQVGIYELGGNAVVLEPGGTISFFGKTPQPEEVRYKELMQRLDAISRDLAELRSR